MESIIEDYTCDISKSCRQKAIKCLICLLVFSGIFCLIQCGEQNGNSDKKPGIDNLTDDSLLTLVQYRTFQYFSDGAETTSGMARERYHVDGIYPENDMNVVTSGGTGFGVMGILVGIEKGFITRDEGLKHLQKVVTFLQGADRFHGAWSHWIYGETGKVKPFSQKDNGADIVETAYLIQGLLAVRQYFEDGTAFSIEKDWYSKRYLAIDQGPVIVMIGNYRTDLLWNLFMSCPEIKSGLNSLGFIY